LITGASAGDADFNDLLLLVKIDNFVDDAEENMTSSVMNESSAAAAALAVQPFDSTPVLIISELQAD
jgi:hypothetical protein